MSGLEPLVANLLEFVAVLFADSGFNFLSGAGDMEKLSRPLSNQSENSLGLAQPSEFLVHLKLDRQILEDSVLVGLVVARCFQLRVKTSPGQRGAIGGKPGLFVSRGETVVSLSAVALVDAVGNKHFVAVEFQVESVALVSFEEFDGLNAVERAGGAPGSGFGRGLLASVHGRSFDRKTVILELVKGANGPLWAPAPQVSVIQSPGTRW